MKLTKQQAKLYKYIKRYIKRNSYAPTTKEIAKYMKLNGKRDKQFVYDNLLALERKGYLNLNGVETETRRIIEIVAQ